MMLFRFLCLYFNLCMSYMILVGCCSCAFGKMNFEFDVCDLPVLLSLNIMVC